jgi:folate-dependent tRNA-U54 methylase TrmFO/GidA
MNSNFGLIEPLEVDVRDKHVRKERMVDRALLDFAKWIRAHDIEIAPARERVQHAEALT